MKKNKLTKSWKNKRPYLLGLLLFSFLFIMCREQEKKIQRDNLDNKISSLDKTIAETKDFYTATVPQNLRHTQSRYIMASDSLNNKSDSINAYMIQNNDLIMMAFNNYAVRVGRDFQMSKFLPQSDIDVLKKHIANIDSIDFIQDMARARILTNNGSLNDLSYFLEMLDFDSVNSMLENKLMWNFYIDSNVIDEEPMELSILNFENNDLNNALKTEKKLLDNAWKKNTLDAELNKNDSLRLHSVANISDSEQYTKTNAKFDSLQTKIISEFTNMDEYEPNFAIPEFDSVHATYMRNDSLIKVYYNTFNGMLKAEDTLEQYRQKMIRERDSLIIKRKELER